MKIVSKILGVALLFGAVFAATYQQKTFLQPHTQVHAQLLEQALFRTNRNTAAYDEQGHVVVTGFYGSSMNKSGIGQYFGIGNGTNSFQIGAESDASNPVASTELDGGYLIHDQASAYAVGGNPPAGSALKGTVTLLPKQTVYGATITYRQTFGGPFHDLFFQVVAPIVQVRNKLGFSVEDEATVNLSGSNFGVTDFFAGNVEVTAGPNAQQRLTAGKMVSGARYATGVADLSLQAGYHLLRTQDSVFDVYLQGIVPTGNRSTGEYLWEPIVGNNGHFGLGIGCDGDLTMWHEADKGRLSLQGGLLYRYLFQSSERRMPGIVTRTEPTFKYNQYVLTGEPGGTVLMPAANNLVQDFDVRPGSQLELLSGLSFHSVGGVTVNVGYNLNWRETESVYRKSNNTFFPTKAGQNYSSSDYVVVAKGASMNLVMPGTTNTIGVLTPSEKAADAINVNTIYTAATAVGVGAYNLSGGALAEGLKNAALTDADRKKAGTDAGANALAGDQKNAYQAGAELYAGSGIDILANTFAANKGATAEADSSKAAVDNANTIKSLVYNLQTANISYTDSVRQESLITHVFGASIGYTFDFREAPILIGFGGQYELPHSSNAGLESYKLFLKMGISF